MPPAARRPLLLISGMSGAGISTALKTLEDLGYEAVDNLRVSLIAPLLAEATPEGPQDKPLAISIDTRTRDFTADRLLDEYARLKDQKGLSPAILFLDCDDEVLIRRFTETRRRHPLAHDRPVADGLARERELLAPLRDKAGLVIDTSRMNLHDLRRVIAGHYRLENQQGLTLHVTSFAFRHGLPREADWVLDVRFLTNPHWQENLRHLSGLDAAVAEHVRQDPVYNEFMQGVMGWLIPLLNRYAQEGKSYLTLAIGCTGGRHRSVAVAEEMATALAAHGFLVGIGHRDLDRTQRLDRARPPQ